MMNLRPYQNEAKLAILEQWSEGINKVLAVLPTGTGKTILFSAVTEECVRQGKRVLILAHRGELLDQAADKLMKSTELGCAVIYCHHHSKGAQGGKRSMDRASGSGVFARDPDALLDLSELDISDSLYKQQEDETVCRICEDWMRRFYRNTDDLCSQDDLVTPSKMLEITHKYLHPNSYKLMMADIDKAKLAVRNRTAWRIEGTLREFPKFAPLNMWFDYPVHREDTVGVLKDCEVEDISPNWKKNFSKKKTNEDRSKERKESIETAFSGVQENGKCRISELAEYIGKSEKTVGRYLKEHGGFWIEEGECGLKAQ